MTQAGETKISQYLFSIRLDIVWSMTVGVLCVSVRVCVYYNKRPIKSHIKSHEICEILSHASCLFLFVKRPRLIIK